MSVVGIDFGTSKCVVVAIHSAEVKVVVNEVSNRKTPTMVGYGDKRRYLGEAAMSRMASQYQNTIPGTVLKRMLGKKFSSADVTEEIASLPLSFHPDDEDRILVDIEHNEQKVAISVEAASGALFGHLKRTAENYLNVAVSDCVIGVPSFYSDVQRRALIDAARIGGFHVLGLMNETTAVALQYGLLRSLPKEKTTRVLFFDLGYAHLNTAIVNLKEGELSVAGCYTDTKLGGRDFDTIITQFMVDHIANTYNLNVHSNRKALLRVQKEAESIKKILSANSDCHWGMECLMDDKDVKGVVLREDLERLAQPLLDRIVVAIEKLLSICKLTTKDIDSVEIVGGCVRIPSVTSKLESFFGSPVSRTCDGDESVGRGCALMSAMLSPKFKVLDFKVNDISPYPIEILHGSVGGTPEGISVIFDQFNPTPSLKAMTFKRDEPLEISFRYMDPASLPDSITPQISSYHITGIPKAEDPENKAKLKVKMKLDISGIVSVPSATLFEEYWVDEVVPVASGAGNEATKPEEPVAEAKTEVGPDDDAMDTTPDGAADSSAAPSQDENKMDTSPDGAAAEAAPATDKPAEPATQVVKKKKVRKVDLPIQAHIYGALRKEKFQAALDVEMKMAQGDKTIMYTLAKKNDLEAFIYDVRDKVTYEALPTASEEAKAAFLKMLDEAEEWLYNEGYDAPAADYVDRLVNLRKTSDPLLVAPVVEEPPRDEPAAVPEEISNKGDAKAAASEERGTEERPVEQQ